MEAFDAGDDVLIVRAEVDGEMIEARGWVSALTNHYDHDPDTDGDRDPTARPRAMTTAERRAYAQSLIDAALAARQAPEAPTMRPIQL